MRAKNPTPNPAPSSEEQFAIGALVRAGWPAELMAKFPISTPEVLRLLRATGRYQLDLAGLLQLADEQSFTPISQADDGNLLWFAADLVLLVAALEIKNLMMGLPPVSAQHGILV